MRACRPWQAGDDPLQQVYIHAPDEPIQTDRVVIYYATAAVVDLLLASLDTLSRFGGDHGAVVVIFATDDGAWQRLRDRPGCYVIRCTLLPGARPGPWAAKSTFFAAPRFGVHAATYLGIEADVLCLGDLSDLWRGVEAGDSRALWGIRPQHCPTLRLTMELLRMDNDKDLLPWIVGPDDSWNYPARRFEFNGGVLAGSASALMAVDRDIMRDFPFSLLACEGSAAGWMEEWLLNLYADYPRHLHARWNHQVYQAHYPCDMADEPWWRLPDPGQPWRIEGEEARLMHFIGGAPAHLAHTRDRKRLFWETYRRLASI